MAEAEGFPLYYPGDARPAFAGEAFLRRLAKQCGVMSSARALTLGMGAGPGPIFLAREFGVPVVAVEATEAEAKGLKERVKAAGVDDRVAVKHGAFDKPPVGDGEFDVIFTDARVPLRLKDAVKGLRRYLAPKGRLCLVYPVRVGRHQNPAALKHWEALLGEPLLLPRECLQLFEQHGYEPQLIETLEDPSLDEFYTAVEQALTVDSANPRVARVREEVALFRGQGGRSTTSFAAMVGRRREPGEKPPVARSE